MSEQVDITKLDLQELYKIAFEQQKQLTILLSQIQQAQTNVAAIESEIAKRLAEDKSG